MPEIVTPGELARELGISPKTLRAWLRAGRDAGYPLLAGHEHYGRWEFTRKEARQLMAEYRRTRGGTSPEGHDSASGHTRTTHVPADRSRGTAKPAPKAATRSARAAATAAAGASTKLPPLPESFTKAGLTVVGFEGWRTWSQLHAAGYADVPSLPGVYVVLAANAAKPTWAHPGTGGRFKDQDPSVSAARLNAEWVPGARTLYIGKADARKIGGKSSGLRKRLAEFGRFGTGEPIGHWGGRLIWQCTNADRLLVAWHAVTWNETARAYEKRLMARFAQLHAGRRPFANLTG